MRIKKLLWSLHLARGLRHVGTYAATYYGFFVSCILPILHSGSTETSLIQLKLLCVRTNSCKCPQQNISRPSEHPK